MPIFSRDQVTYDGAAMDSPEDPTFDHESSDFDGDSGLLNFYAYSASIGVGFDIALHFNGDNSGSWVIDSGFLGTDSGSFEIVETPVLADAAAWMFGSALIGLAGLRREISTL